MVCLGKLESPETGVLDKTLRGAGTRWILLSYTVVVQSAQSLHTQSLNLLVRGVDKGSAGFWQCTKPLEHLVSNTTFFVIC